MRAGLYSKRGSRDMNEMLSESFSFGIRLNEISVKIF
jgi:hypothetical protein